MGARPGAAARGLGGRPERPHEVGGPQRGAEAQGGAEEEGGAQGAIDASSAAKKPTTPTISLPQEPATGRRRRRFALPVHSKLTAWPSGGTLGSFAVVFCFSTQLGDPVLLFFPPTTRSII